VSEWKEYQLGDLGTFFGGVATIKREDYGFGTPFITYKNVYKNSRIDTSILERMNVKKNDIIKRNCLYGDIFFTASSETPDEVAMSSVLLDNISDLTFNGFCKRFRLHDFNTLIPEYARYLLRGEEFRNSAYEYANGDVRFNISQESLSKISINIPDLPTQTAIAGILSSLDDKIELNNKINQELENLAQTLFKQWFIDFEFPDENGEPYKSSGGEMVESEFGEIPKRWSESKLEDISNITIGRTPSRQEHHWFSENSNDVKWISIKDMGNCGAFILNTSEFLTEEAVSKFKIPIIERNTVIISFKLTVGRISITTERMLSNEAIAHINLIDDSMSPEFIYLYLKQFNFDSLGSTSSIATAINSKAIKALKFIKPSQDVFQNFQLQVIPIFQQILSYTNENQELTNLRDTLLPKLISGELEVSQTQTTA
jgi:type I restriction enzyme S subunit